MGCEDSANWPGQGIGDERSHRLNNLESLGGESIASNSGVNYLWGAPMSYESKRDAKVVARSMATAILRFPASKPRLNKIAIRFDETDYPKGHFHQGRHLLVVSPMVGEARVHRVLVGRGSSLGLIMMETLKHMQIPWTRVLPLAE